jgi:protein TonB
MARQPPSEATRPGSQAAAPSAAGIGRATGAVVPPGLDSTFRNTAPAYPEASRLRGEQGAVGLDLSIDAQGRVVSVVVARSSGSPALDAAARDAVTAWRFRPAMVDGRPVPGAIRTTIHFRLN